MFAEVSGNKNYKFKRTDKQIKFINNFIRKKEDLLGKHWLFDFFLFQFNYYHKQKTRFGKGIVHLNWVLGDKAIHNWENRTEEQIYYTTEFRRNYNLTNILLPKKQLELSNDYYDIKRKTGDIIQCSILKLYDEKNVVCRLCKNKKICKQL